MGGKDGRLSAGREADSLRAMIDAIRECLGLALLYDEEEKNRRTYRRGRRSGILRIESEG